MTTLPSPGKPDLTITATPCRHGPPLSRPIVGEVIGFALAHEQQTDGVLWISEHFREGRAAIEAEPADRAGA